MTRGVIGIKDSVETWCSIITLRSLFKSVLEFFLTKSESPESTITDLSSDSADAEAVSVNKLKEFFHDFLGVPKKRYIGRD